ncbi:MAG: amidase [Acetobacteraceae bacterium]|nr:amidase [Acetobacteraceae bacterium]MSP29535.1 amidase [Acetobacteraceae bacterium]
MSDMVDLGVRAGAAALAAGGVSALSLANICLERIGNGRGRALNAFIHVAADTARAAAQASDERRAAGRPLSALDGVPIAIKDNMDVFGMPTTNGLGASWMPAADAPVIRRLRDAGMVNLGKLNMHEAALGATNDNPHYGRCEHPDFPGFTPGGSSGGSAVAVAAGLCPVSLGTDTMGSVRLPAAYCGIVGFKPSRGYWPVDGVMPLAFGLDTIGPLARSVGDIAFLLGEPLDAFAPATLRFARLANARQVATEAECLAALDAGLGVLATLGVAAPCLYVPGYDPGQARRAGFIVSEVDAAQVHARLLQTTPHAFSPLFRVMLDYGMRVAPERYQAERRKLAAISTAFLGVFDACDVVLTLTAPQRAFSFDAPVPLNQADLTALANFAGCPALSLPLPVPAGALPVGLQLIAAPGRDTMLLSAGAWIESCFQA